MIQDRSIKDKLWALGLAWSLTAMSPTGLGLNDPSSAVFGFRVTAAKSGGFRLRKLTHSLTGSEASKLSMSCSDTVETTLHSYLRYSGRLMQRRSAGLVARLKI